jgi:arylformamidase
MLVSGLPDSMEGRVIQKNSWIDISVTLCDVTPTWPGSDRFRAQRVSDMNKGAIANSSTLVIGTHAGTHIDSPLHFVKDGRGIDTLPLDATNGRTRVFEFRKVKSITPEMLYPCRIRRGERVLFKTDNSFRCWELEKFVEDYVHISSPAAAYLASRGVKSVGVDYLSVGEFGPDGVAAHQAFLRHGLWLIEGLNLSTVAPGRYELICLPLKLAGCEASPARAMLRPIR